jgi:hypothetical protein
MIPKLLEAVLAATPAAYRCGVELKAGTKRDDDDGGGHHEIFHAPHSLKGQPDKKKRSGSPIGLMTRS